jgi:hypothetical protein
MESNRIRRQILFLAILLFSFGASLQAAFENQVWGVSFAARGSGGFGSMDRSFALFRNPAVAALHAGNNIELYYENFYGIRELNLVAIDAGMHIASYPVGIAVKRFGNALYSETEAHLVFAARIMDSLSIGIAINGCFLQIERYGQSSAVGFDLAGYYRFASRFAIGFLIHNLNEPEIGQAKERIPGVFCLGITYCPAPSLEINIDVVKENRFAFDYRIGLRYHANAWLQISGGMKDLTNQYSAGLQIITGPFNIGYALEYHSLLGASNIIGAGYGF